MKKIVVLIRQTVTRHILVTTREPRVGELLSSRHPGLFDAEDHVQEGEPPACHSLQHTAWLIDRSIPWIADRVRQGELKAYLQNGEIGITGASLRRVVNEGIIETDDQDWCCRVDSVVSLRPGLEAVAEVYAGAPVMDYHREDRRQLPLLFKV